MRIYFPYSDSFNIFLRCMMVIRIFQMMEESACSEIQRVDHIFNSTDPTYKIKTKQKKMCAHFCAHWSPEIVHIGCRFLIMVCKQTVDEREREKKLNNRCYSAELLNKAAFLAPLLEFWSSRWQQSLWFVFSFFWKRLTHLTRLL